MARKCTATRLRRTPHEASTVPVRRRASQSDMSTYAYDNAWPQARRRLAFLEAAFDPGTIWYLERLGVGESWRCWEVGAGGGSIAAWLCRRVGDTGHVLT